MNARSVAAASRAMRALSVSALVAASACQDASGIVNWLRRTGDQFAERSTGWKLAVANAILNTAGLLTVAYGVAHGCRKVFGAVRFRIEDRNDIDAKLCRTVHRAVGVNARKAPIRRD